MLHHVIIETHRVPDGYFVARVTKGPTWSRGWTAEDGDRRCAYLTLCQDLENERPRDTFSYIHAEG